MESVLFYEYAYKVNNLFTLAIYIWLDMGCFIGSIIFFLYHVILCFNISNDKHIYSVKIFAALYL